MATKKQPPAESGESGGEQLPSLADATNRAIEEAETSAKEGGGGNPVLNPETSKMPTPGTTGELDVVSTDQATSLNPNVTVSGTKPAGDGTQVLLDTVDPAVANAALLGPAKAVKPQNPSLAPDDTSQRPGPGEVLFEVTADNRPFWSGNGVGQGGPLEKGRKVVMTREEADILVQTRAGRIVSAEAPASDTNAQPEGGEV